MNNNKSFDAFLNQERAKQLDGQSFMSSIAEIATYLFTLLAGSFFFPLMHLVAWFIPAALVSILVYFFVSLTSKQSADQRLNASIIGAFLIGLAWGLFPYFFFVPDHESYTILIVGIFTGFISGGLSSTFAYPPSFYAFAAGTYLPFVSRLIMIDTSLHKILAGLISFYVITLCISSRNMAQLFTQASQANFEKAAAFDELTNEKETAIRATQAKTKFLAAASHDLRQPINAIGLFASTLKNATTKERQDIALSKIEQSVDALNGLLHAFLDISRLDAGTVESNPSHRNLINELQQSLDQFGDRLDHLDIIINIDASTAVFVDRLILLRVMSNLIDNAIKYTEHGSITLESHAYEDNIILTITDTGEGISDSKLYKIFDEFEQINNPERDRNKGFGLGLSIVKRLCEIGDIGLGLESQLNVGTQVQLILPKGDPSCIKNTNQDKETEAKLDHMLILVIENEQDILDGMALLLDAWGCDYILSQSTSEALIKLGDSNQVPDAILSDYRLSADETGIAAIEAVREEYNSNIPSIILTGDIAPERVSELSKLKQEVLYKPINPHQLKSKLVKIIRKRPFPRQ